MSKPWDETWTVRGSAVQADGRDVLDAWYRGDDPVGGDARARLAAAAPDLVRALLAVEWSGAVGTPPDAIGCISCGGVHPDHATAACVERMYGFLRQQVSVGHRDGCVVAAALRKAGVVE